MKNPPIRDRKYLDWLRTQPCVITGLRSTEYNAVDPMHISTLGKGVKSGDNEALPVLHNIHADSHAHGEISMFRREAKDWLLRAALRAYAREMYREWERQQLWGKK